MFFRFLVLFLNPRASPHVFPRNQEQRTLRRRLSSYKELTSFDKAFGGFLQDFGGGKTPWSHGRFGWKNPYQQQGFNKALLIWYPNNIPIMEVNGREVSFSNQVNFRLHVHF